MNPYIYLAALILWGASTVGAFFYGQTLGAAGEKANQAEIEKAVADTRRAALEGAADAIANIKIKNTTIQGRVQTVVRDNPVYVECKHAPDGMSLINQALTGRPGPTGGGGMP